MNRTNLKVAGLLALITSIGTATSGHAQTLLLSLQASNYNTATGVWTDSSGNNDNATVSTHDGLVAAGLATNATANGSSAVSFGGNSAFTLGTTIAAGTYTAFVVADPGTAASSGKGLSFFGGGGNDDNVQGSFQYRISENSGMQDVVRQSQEDAGAGTNVVPTSSFSILDVTAGGGNPTSYRLNGAADGTGSAETFSSGISDIGANALRGTQDETFIGNIADIEIFSGVLTSAQITTEEANLKAEYFTAAPTPEPSTWALLLGGIGSLTLLRRFRIFGQV